MTLHLNENGSIEPFQTRAFCSIHLRIVFKSPMNMFRKEISLFIVHESNLSQQVNHDFLCLQHSMRMVLQFNKELLLAKFYFVFLINYQ